MLVVVFGSIELAYSFFIEGLIRDIWPIIFIFSDFSNSSNRHSLNKVK